MAENFEFNQLDQGGNELKAEDQPTPAFKNEDEESKEPGSAIKQTGSQEGAGQGD